MPDPLFLQVPPGVPVPGVPSEVVPLVVHLIGALAILLVGWIVGGLLARLVRSALRRFSLDSRLSAAVPSGAMPAAGIRLDRLLASVVFWVVMVLAVVAALNVLNLTTVSEPLNQFLNQIFAFLPKLGAAALLAAVGWLVAILARSALLGATQRLNLDERLFEGEAEAGASPGQAVSGALGDVVFWLVLLFFLPLVLNALNLGAQVTPVVNLFDTFLSALPRLIKAAAIAAVGWFLARIVRTIVASLLAATGLDRVGAEFGLNPQRGAQSLSWLVGTLVFVLILIPTATASLDALAIPAVSGPATAMLDRILTALPQIFTAALILVAGFVLGRFTGQLVARLLAGIGFDGIFQWLGMPDLAGSALADAEPDAAAEANADGPVRTPQRSASDVLGVVTLVGILLFSSVAATNVLALPALTDVMQGLLRLFGQILSGLVVFAVGLYLSNLAAQLVRSSGGSQAQLLARTSRVAIVIFTGAMALQQIGVAPSIVNLAFGLLLGSVAVAGAVAFGLGGREVAAEQLREWIRSNKQLDS
ncbi:MAG: mechanosensitive ion channel [Synechococcaceae cyanobacterium]|jgi:hypothetical protein